MTRRVLCLFLMTVGGLCACSQPGYNPNDSLRVVGAEWRVDSLEGFVFKRYHFGEGELFCSAQDLFVIEIPASSPRHLAFAYDSIPTGVSELAGRKDAWAAVNGSFFDMTSGSPVCYLRVDGVLRGENTPQKTDSVNRKYYQYAVLVLSGGGARLLVPDSCRRWEDILSDGDIMTAGPMLVKEGQYVSQRDDRSFVTRRHNRTALGVTPEGTTFLVVVDGRFEGVAEGLTLYELQRVMRWLGCTEAINLDGGGSTTMYIKGRGVVNFPSDNQKHDHEGERAVSNAILVL